MSGPARAYTSPTAIANHAVRVSRAEARARLVRWLLRRDGDRCWFCNEKLHADITVEHLTPKSQGGRYGENAVLAHRQCNEGAGDRPFEDKLELRRRLRLEGRTALKAIVASLPVRLRARTGGVSKV